MLPRISGKQKFRGKTIKIITFGEKNKKCFGCRSEDHTIRECSYKNTKCSVCGKNGHQTCTMANRLERLHENDQPGNEEDEDFDENETTYGFRTFFNSIRYQTFFNSIKWIKNKANLKKPSALQKKRCNSPISE